MNRLEVQSLVHRSPVYKKESPIGKLPKLQRAKAPKNRPQSITAQKNAVDDAAKKVARDIQLAEKKKQDKQNQKDKQAKEKLKIKKEVQKQINQMTFLFDDKKNKL